MYTQEREGDDKVGLMEGDLTIGDEIGTIIIEDV